MVCEHRLRPHKENTKKRPGLPSPLSLGYDFSPLDITSVQSASLLDCLKMLQKLVIPVCWVPLT